MNQNTPLRVIVGVEPDQADAIIHHAASLASRLGADLVCAWADPRRAQVEQFADGSETSRPIDPDVPETGTPEFPAELASHLARLLTPTGLRWETRRLSGVPAKALGELGDALGAMLIVVGAHRGTVRGTVEEFFNRSVAVQLSHRQHRPVVVVPVDPVPFGRPLPWETE